MKSSQKRRMSKLERGNNTMPKKWRHGRGLDRIFDWDHVLRGEIKRGDAKGYHAESSADGSARIKPGAEISYHDNGVYEAKVQIWNANSRRWKDKARESSFFPTDWSVARIKYEVIEAFKAKTLSANNPHQWFGTTPNGMVIEGYLRDGVITFYPLGSQ